MVKISTLSLLLVLALCFQAYTQPIHNPDISQKIDALVQTYYEQGQFSGSVLVAEKGNAIFNKEYGFKDVAGTQSLNSESVFEIASLSKQFTALMVMMMQQEGKLQYDDKITKYFPALPYSNITIRHLLSHTSGLSERKFFMWAGQHMTQGKIYNNDFILGYLSDQKPELSFAPGAQWEYSNVGYMLLASLLQQVSGKSYITLLNERILEPLGMEQSGIYSQNHKGSQMPHYAFSRIFNAKDSVFMPAFGLAWSDSLYGGVGIISNTTDLLKWDRALYSDQLVDQQALSEAFTAFPLSNGQASEYGLGWFIRENFRVNGKNVGKRVDHYGLWPGYESSIVRYIDQDKTIIILSNQAPSVKDTLVEEISRLIFEQQP